MVGGGKVFAMDVLDGFPATMWKMFQQVFRIVIVALRMLVPCRKQFTFHSYPLSLPLINGVFFL